MKKVISLLCVCLVLLGAISALGAYEQDETIGLDFVTYKVRDGKATVYWVSREQEGKIIIPDNVNGVPVSSIGEYAFNDCIHITEIELPESIETIYGPAFRKCTNLEKINIPCSYITAPAFQYCPRLKEVILDENLSYLHHGVFSHCKIEKLVIKNKNITIQKQGNLNHPEPQTGSFIDTKIGTVYSYRGSNAEAYAKEMNINFIALEKELTVEINNIELECDSQPYIKNDRTMVPMRAIFEALGAEVSWDNDTRTAIGVKGDTEVKITIGENVLYKNGEATLLDCEAEITNDRTMVPVRVISEAFGCTVNWNDETKTVEITN